MGNNISRLSPNVFKGLSLSSPDGSVIVKQGNSNLYTKNLDGFSYSGELTTTSNSALQLPSGTSAQRPAGNGTKIRFNTTLNAYEGYNPNSGLWGPIGVAGIGTGYIEHNHTISDVSTIASGKNAISAGPITITNTGSVTVPNGSVWTVV